ncbi:ferritin-like domain-containing protein [Parvularcula dongshanensis]|uniref:Uncharacterized protein (TIGR02284 family) n=1 Tax=Parvularcula dongshanensis TaxID=1173995 RepID=A0A840I5W9_9PROT|nr:PA2169 family four-helix-bundle protein [Parvularcula dongshanensis]MBB4659410.1 uncharacterized protein (TIGR02284 family) [Parvularcula dongshanensis]
MAKEIKDELKDVLTRVVDSADGYENAAEDAKAGRFAVMFREKAQERRGFASEIRNHLTGLGEDVKEDGSLLAGAHRTFTELKNAVTGGSDDAILKEIERGESTLLKEYDDALEDIPSTDMAYGVLQRQRESVSRSLSEVKTYES